MTVQIAVRLPQDVVRGLDSLVPATHRTRSEAVRRAVEMYLARLAAERDAAIYERDPLTEGELALADDPEGWAATPAW